MNYDMKQCKGCDLRVRCHECGGLPPCALVAQNSTSTNTTKSEISKLIRELEVSHTINLSIDDIILKLRKLSDIC